MLRSFLGLGVMMLAAACSSTSGGNAVSQDCSGDAGGGDAGPDALQAGVLPFTPSNVDLSGIDLSKITDEDVAADCQIRGTGASDCFAHAAFATVKQSDGSQVGVYVVKSLKVEPSAHMFISGLTGNLPVVLVSLGDFSLMGTLDAHSQDIHGTGGGFESLADQDGFGPGGGPKGSATTGGGGGSYCGQGGQGNVALNAIGTPGPKSAASGNPEIVPLRGGASGGAGGSPGGAGGSLLVEATDVKIAGIIAANGGGGGGAGAGLDSGKNGSANATPAAGGPGATPGAQGSAGATIDGAAAAPATVNGGGASGGGGGAGRVRINSRSGQADLAGATFSPALTTPCVTQGTVK